VFITYRFKSEMLRKDKFTKVIHYGNLLYHNYFLYIILFFG